MKFILGLMVLWGTASHADTADELVREFYVFEVPGLAKTGPAFVSWFFIRNHSFWGYGETLDLDKLEWPGWDLSAIPINIAPVPKQKAFILIYDEKRQLIQEQELKEPFHPELYYASAKIKPAFFQVRVSAVRSHLELTSPFYPWYQKKRIATCNVDTSAPDFSVAKSPQLKACLSTLQAYASPDNTETRQFYINLNWPVIRGRENIVAAKDFERDLRAAARKKKMVFISTKGKGTKFEAEVGLTLKETVPVIGFPAANLVTLERAEQSPDTKTISRPIYEQDYPDGSRIRVIAFYSDAQPQRQLESGRVGKYQIGLQFIEGAGEAKADTPVKIVQTRSYERRTGFLGYLRPLQALVSGGYNLLSSSPGTEKNSFFGLPAFDVRYNWTKIGLQPYVNFEKQIIHEGTTLEINELKVGLNKSFHWLEGGYYSLAYDEYQLSGRNPGLPRLGGITALALGIGAKQRFEEWQLGEHAEILFGNDESFNSRFDVGRFFGSNSDSRYYLGGFLGYGIYRGYVVDKLKNRTLYSEERLQLGVTLGWIGPDSF